MNKFRKAGFIDYNGHLEVHSSLLSVVLADLRGLSTRHDISVTASLVSPRTFWYVDSSMGVALER